MPTFRKKPVEIEATQWFTNGDHPLDYADNMLDYSTGNIIPADAIREMGWEGQVVRYFRHPGPEYPGAAPHGGDKGCGRIWHDHGWIDTLEGGHTVCPGDWIITGVQGERYPCKPDIFAATYDEVV